MPADQQRQRVYEAEQRVCDQLDFAARGATAVTVHGSTITVLGDVRFGSLPAARRWLDHVRAQPWFRCRWPGAAAVPLALRARRGQRRAHYEADRHGGTIAVPVPANATGWAMREMVLLHELAHHATDCDREPATAGDVPAAHDRAFTGVMLELVECTLGAETRLLLAAAYHDGGVQVAVPDPPHQGPTGPSAEPHHEGALHE